MCIRDRSDTIIVFDRLREDIKMMRGRGMTLLEICLLYTSDAADDLLCVDLGGRCIIKKKQTTLTT